jgi:NADPH-dependent 2,4-dienoyl-CoA reductase/sulfur reductase-like enzyme
MPEQTAEVTVVGAGPAGLAAAVSAAEAGARVILVDAAAQPGGQYWRHRDESVHPTPDGHGHHDWATFLDLRQRLLAAERDGLVEYRRSTSVWLAERAGAGFRLRTLRAGVTAAGATPGTILSERVVLCPGAYDRQLPIPGWDLPGVVAAGGAQALLKGHGTLVGDRVVVAGTGPFLLPVAAGLVDAGADVVALCEAADPLRWVRHLGTAVRSSAKLAQGAEYLAVLARHGVRLRTRTGVVEILGADRVTGARLSRFDADGRPTGRTWTVAADTVALGWGFTAQLELPLMLGAEAALGADGSLAVRVDPAQRTSVPGLYVAGEATGVGGAVLSVAEGHVAGRAAAGAAPQERHRRAVLANRAFARAMHDVYRVPAAWPDWLTPETILCRCEEVPVGAVRAARRDLGAADPQTLRSVTRVGMGRCQSRMCGWGAACLLAADGARTLETDDLLATSRRPLAAHVPLGALATLDEAAPTKEAIE